MRYSVSTWIFGEESQARVFGILADLGYDAVELEGEPAKLSAPKVRAAAESAGLDIVSLAGMFPWPTKDRDLSSPDGQVRARAVEYLRRSCDLAHELGASILVVSPTPVGKTGPDREPFGPDGEAGAGTEEWKWAVDSVAEAARHAEATGVRLAIEPLNRYETYLVNTAESGLEFVSQTGSEAVKLHLDTFHMNIEEASVRDAILKAGENLVNFHVADSNRQAVGRGHLDFPAVVAALVEIGYEGALTLEPLPPVSNPYAAAGRESFRGTLRQYLEASLRRLKPMVEAALHPE